MNGGGEYSEYPLSQQYWFLVLSCGIPETNTDQEKICNLFTLQFLCRNNWQKATYDFGSL